MLYFQPSLGYITFLFDSLLICKEVNSFYTGVPCFMALSFIVPCRYCIFFFLQMEGLQQHSFDQSCQLHFFPSSSAHFLSLCNILVILTVFHTFSLLHLLQGSVISDCQGYYFLKKFNSLKAKMMVSICGQ